MLRLFAPLLLLAVLLGPSDAVGQDSEYGSADEYDPTGIWHSEARDLVVRRTGRTTWIGYPTEGRGETSGRTWFFAATGRGRYRFWIMLEGKATTQKLAEQDVDMSGKRDEFVVEIPDRRGLTEKFRFQRIFAKIPEKYGDTVVTFLPSGRARVRPDQDVDVRLVRLFGRAVEAARAADPDLRRINICATIDQNVGRSKRHSRFVRQAIAIDLVNGAGEEHWEEDVGAKVRALKAGEAPPSDPRTDYARHATALLLALLMQEEVDEVVCNAILDKRTVPYLEWWIGRHGRSFPTGSPSVVKFRELIEAMLDHTSAVRRRMSGLLYVSVRDWDEPPCRHRKCREKRYDRK
jgi:hypothetical protein